MRVADRGSRSFSVTVDRTHISGLRTVTAEFARGDGHLVDVECNRVSCDRFRGADLNALLRDMQCTGSRKVGLNHCASGALYGPRRRKRRQR